MGLISVLLKFWVVRTYLVALAPLSSPLCTSGTGGGSPDVGDGPDGCLGGVTALIRGLGAVRAENIFPFEITYTEQKCGADFSKPLPTS